VRPPLALAAGLAVGLLAALLAADPQAAHAAADIGNAGKNIGQTASSWAKWLFGGGVALGAAWFSLPANRKAGPALVFVAFALLLGGFVFSPELVGDASQSLWKTVLK
jgi:xanthosine utilization system XapX-like protein